MRRNTHDSSLPVGVQVTSVRLLLNLVEVMFNRRNHQPSAEAYRALLARSLDACAGRLAAVEHSLPRLLPIAAPGEMLRHFCTIRPVSDRFRAPRHLLSACAGQLAVVEHSLARMLPIAAPGEPRGFLQTPRPDAMKDCTSPLTPGSPAPPSEPCWRAPCTPALAA